MNDKAVSRTYMMQKPIFVFYQPATSLLQISFSGFKLSTLLSDIVSIT